MNKAQSLRMKKAFSYIILLLFIVISLPSFAAGKRIAGHFQMEFGGGAVMFPFNQVEVGSILAGGQADITLKYNYLFNNNENWGLDVGVGLASFIGSQTINEQMRYSTIDSEGDPYVLMADVSNWHEREQVYAFTVPIGIFYQYKSRYSNVGLLTSLNFKAIVPLYSHYRAVFGDITTKGDYSQWGGTILENLPQHGFTTSSDFHPTGSLNTPMQFSTELQVGALFTFDRKTEMFLTAFLEYGFKNMVRPRTDKPLFNSISSYNGYYGSMYATDTRPLVFGIKIGFRIVDIHGCNCIRY